MRKRAPGWQAGAVGQDQVRLEVGDIPGLQSRQLDVGGYRLWRRLFVEVEVCLEAPRSLEAAIPSSSPLLLSR